MSHTMIDVVWRLSTDTLDEESDVRPLLELLAGSPVFRADRYDLNQRGKWRAWDLDRAVVDTLTQRTQLVRIDGRAESGGDGGAPEAGTGAGGLERRLEGTRALIATGKHDEQPTCMIRLALEDRARRESVTHRAVDQWGEVCERLPIDRLHVTGPACRSWLLELVDDEDMWPEQSIPAAYVVGWPEGRPPREWDVRELDDMPRMEGADNDGSLPEGVRLPSVMETGGASVIWWVDPAGEPPSDAGQAGRIIERVGRLGRVRGFDGQSSS